MTKHCKIALCVIILNELKTDQKNCFYFISYHIFRHSFLRNDKQSDLLYVVSIVHYLRCQIRMKNHGIGKFLNYTVIYKFAFNLKFDRIALGIVFFFLNETNLELKIFNSQVNFHILLSLFRKLIKNNAFLRIEKFEFYVVFN